MSKNFKSLGLNTFFYLIQCSSVAPVGAEGRGATGEVPRSTVVYFAAVSLALCFRAYTRIVQFDDDPTVNEVINLDAELKPHLLLNRHWIECFSS